MNAQFELETLHACRMHYSIGCNFEYFVAFSVICEHYIYIFIVKIPQKDKRVSGPNNGYLEVKSKALIKNHIGCSR